MTAVKYEVFPLPSPYSFECSNYTDENGGKRTVTAVIVPVSFTRIDAFTWRIGWACNFQRHCRCSSCVYAEKKNKEAR